MDQHSGKLPSESAPSTDSMRISSEPRLLFANGVFAITVPRAYPHAEGFIRSCLNEHGFAYSVQSSTPDTAVLYSQEPFAAVSFYQIANEAARKALQHIKEGIDQSEALEGKDYGIDELWPFQRANLDYALQRRRTLIGDEPGLGKTITAIAYANKIEARSVLVICPATIRFQWKDRIEQWTQIRPYRVYVIRSGKHGVIPPAPTTAVWNVLSYELSHNRSIYEALIQRQWDLIILDEPHFLKSGSARRTQAIFGGGRFKKGIFEVCKHALGLTGTPMLNRPRELYTIIRAFCWDAIDFMSYDRFCATYNPTPSMQIKTKYGYKAVPDFKRSTTRRLYELQARLRYHFMVRHVKRGPRGVMNQLQMPVYDLIRVEKTDVIKQALQVESLLQIDLNMLDAYSGEILGHIAAARQQMGLAMAPQVADYVATLIESGEQKLVLFGWHTAVLDDLQLRLRKFGVLRIDGSTPINQRPQITKQFIEDDSIHILLGNALSLGIGTDGLQMVCNHALIVEPDWTPATNIQCFDRLDRGGQKRQVQGEIFVAPDSIAERILARALQKLHVIHNTLDAKIDLDKLAQ